MSQSRLKGRDGVSKYLKESRSWTYSLLFIFPLVVFYQFVIFATAATGEITSVNGAQALLSYLLGFVGIDSYLAFFFVVLIAVMGGIVWDMKKNNRTSDELEGAYFIIMLAESIVYAFVFAIFVSAATSAILDPLSLLGIVTTSVGITAVDFSIINEIALGIGAGVYEEVVFRVILISGPIKLYEASGEKPDIAVYALLVVVSSVIFAAAHATGTNSGNALEPYVFTFRAIGGAVFAVLYLVRGFGVVVYTHALYDVFIALSII